MSSARIGIVGGTGGMGKWFSRFFRGEGCEVHAWGKSSFADLPARLPGCDVVVVSVPIGVTREVIEWVGPHVREDSLLMDLTSLKTEPVSAMLRASCSEVIGLHPLFGPDVPSLQDQNVAICPARGERWLPWLRGMLETNGARVVETTPETHDTMMAWVQVLTHLSTLAMGLALGESGASMAELDRFSTPVFRAKMAMMEKIFQGSPPLYAEIIASNPRTPEVLDLWDGAMEALRQAAGKRDPRALSRLIHGQATRDPMKRRGGED
jgi:prephenate dehydrogenase